MREELAKLYKEFEEEYNKNPFKVDYGKGQSYSLPPRWEDFIIWVCKKEK